MLGRPTRAQVRGVGLGQAKQLGHLKAAQRSSARAGPWGSRRTGCGCRRTSAPVLVHAFRVLTKVARPRQSHAERQLQPGPLPLTVVWPRRSSRRPEVERGPPGLPGARVLPAPTGGGGARQQFDRGSAVRWRACGEREAGRYEQRRPVGGDGPPTVQNRREPPLSLAGLFCVTVVVMPEAAPNDWWRATGHRLGLPERHPPPGAQAAPRSRSPSSPTSASPSLLQLEDYMPETGFIRRGKAGGGPAPPAPRRPPDMVGDLLSASIDIATVRDSLRTPRLQRPPATSVEGRRRSESQSPSGAGSGVDHPPGAYSARSSASIPDT